MQIINRTPHAIALVGSDGVTRIINKTGSPVRVETAPSEQVDTIDTVPIHAAPRVLRITNLPAAREGVINVVSQIAALAIAALHPDRRDIVYPGTGPTDKPQRVRKEMLAATRLIRAV
jgi:hypothetical protein